MGLKLSELEENTRIVFHIHHGEQQMDLGGILKKHLQDNLALITLDYKGSQRLVFENVKNSMPFMPRRICIASLSPDFLLRGRSICVMSPVITMREFSPRRVKNIIICSVVAFCASSRIIKAFESVRPRI